jgi:hypothetical protein
MVSAPTSAGPPCSTSSKSKACLTTSTRPPHLAAAPSSALRARRPSLPRRRRTFRRAATVRSIVRRRTRSCFRLWRHSVMRRAITPRSRTRQRTGHPHSSRLARDFGGGHFGSESYAMEELVTELGAAFRCADLDLTLEPRDDHASYIASWSEVLKTTSERSSPLQATRSGLPEPPSRPACVLAVRDVPTLVVNPIGTRKTIPMSIGRGGRIRTGGPCTQGSHVGFCLLRILRFGRPFAFSVRRRC